MAAGADLAEDNRSAHGEPDAERDGGEDRREHEERDGRSHTVEQYLGGCAGAVAGPGCRHLCRVHVARLRGLEATADTLKLRRITEDTTSICAPQVGPDGT
jgi:hypothetical protein